MNLRHIVRRGFRLLSSRGGKATPKRRVGGESGWESALLTAERSRLPRQNWAMSRVLFVPISAWRCAAQTGRAQRAARPGLPYHLKSEATAQGFNHISISN